MAIINSYPTVTPTEGDLVLISDVSEDGNPTRTATVSSLGLLSQGGGLVGPTGPKETLELQVLPALLVQMELTELMVLLEQTVQTARMVLTVLKELPVQMEPL